MDRSACQCDGEWRRWKQTFFQRQHETGMQEGAMNFTPGTEYEFQQFASHSSAVWNQQIFKIITNQTNEKKEPA